MKMSLLTPLRTRAEEREAARDAAFLAAAEASMRERTPVAPEKPVESVEPVQKVLPLNPTVVALQKELDWVRHGGDEKMSWNQNYGIYLTPMKLTGRPAGCVVGHVNYVHRGRRAARFSSIQMRRIAADQLGITFTEASLLWCSSGPSTAKILESLIDKYSTP